MRMAVAFRLCASQTANDCTYTYRQRLHGPAGPMVVVMVAGLTAQPGDASIPPAAASTSTLTYPADRILPASARA